MSKVNKKVLKRDYMEINKCRTKIAKLNPNFSFSWFSVDTVITGS